MVVTCSRRSPVFDCDLSNDKEFSYLSWRDKAPSSLMLTSEFAHVILSMSVCFAAKTSACAGSSPTHFAGKRDLDFVASNSSANRPSVVELSAFGYLVVSPTASLVRTTEHSDQTLDSSPHHRSNPVARKTGTAAEYCLSRTEADAWEWPSGTSETSRDHRKFFAQRRLSRSCSDISRAICRYHHADLDTMWFVSIIRDLCCCGFAREAPRTLSLIPTQISRAAAESLAGTTAAISSPLALI